MRSLRAVVFDLWNTLADWPDDRSKELTREALVPQDGVVETLVELRRRGRGVGLISVCSEEVPAVWTDSPLAPHVDAAVFSASCGLMKPDPRIYRLVTDELSVEPEECLYVGDGAHDELGGAARVGMRPILKETSLDVVRDWAGPRVTSIPEVLDLV